jgi:hypothetical protein
VIGDVYLRTLLIHGARSVITRANLCRLACDGKVPLAEVQRGIQTDWIAAYRKYISTSLDTLP